MLNAFIFSVLAQAPLILGGPIVYWFRVPIRIVGWLAGLGAGALVSAIAYSLVTQAELAGLPTVIGGMLIGAVVFVVLDILVENRFGEAAGAIGIVLGSVIDGVPESIIFGVQLASGSAISMAFLTAVMISNIPQSMAPSADLGAVQAGIKLGQANIFDYYRSAFDDIGHSGFPSYVSRVGRPYLLMAVTHLDPQYETYIERALKQTRIADHTLPSRARQTR